MPGYDLSSKVQNAGAAVVLYGSSSGITMSGARLITENTPGVPQTASPSDEFGSSLAAGNLGNGSLEDLVVGAGEKTVAGISEVGAVFVLYGTSSGLPGPKAQFLWEGSPGVGGNPERLDEFGSGALFVANFGRGPTGDLAIGVPRKAVGSAAGSGIVDVLYGSTTGLVPKGSQTFHYGGGSLPGSPEQGANLGFSLR